MIKHDFRKQTYTEDDKRRQMALLAFGKKRPKVDLFSILHFHDVCGCQASAIGEACSLSLAFAGMALEAAQSCLGSERL